MATVTIPEEVIEEVTNRYVNLVIGGQTKVDFEASIKLAEKIYEMSAESYPEIKFPGRERVYFASSMLAAQSLGNRLRVEDWDTINKFFEGKDPQATFWDKEDRLPNDSYQSYGCIGLAHCNWAAVVDAYEQCKLDMEQKFIELRDLLKAAGVYDCIAYDQAIVMVSCPVEVHQDSEFRPHNLTGPSIVEASGRKYYHIHGVEITNPEWITNPKSISARDILKQNNVEVRRAMLLLKGIEEFVKEANGEVLDTWNDAAGMPCRLVRVQMEDDEPLVVYQWKCPTSGKEGFLRVNPNLTKCADAVRSTWPTVVDYAPESET